MAQTLSHEIVHSVKVWNKEGYTQLQKYVMEAMGEDQFDTLLKEKLTGDDYSAAYDEVIADSCEMLLRDSKALEKIARENASLFVKIKEAVQSFIDKLKKALKEAYGDTGELHSAAEALKLSLSDMTEIQQLFDDVLYKSISNMKNALAEAENAKTRENLEILEKAAEKEKLKYSIEYTTDNKPVAIIDNDILDGVPKSQWIQTVKDTILNKFAGGIPISGRLIKVNKISRSEFTNSKYSKYLRAADGSVYQDKLKAANNLDDIILASTNYINEDLKHSRNDSFKEFARGDVLINVGQNGYIAKVIVGFTTNNQMVLYDIVDFRRTNLNIKKRATQSAMQNAGSERNRATLNNSISEAGQNVKTKLNSVTESLQFKRWFGDWQNNPKKASKVINKDGTPRVVYYETKSESGTSATGTNAKDRGLISEGMLLFTSQKGSYTGANPKIEECYLCIKNPLYIDSRGYYYANEYYDRHAESINLDYLTGDYDGIIIENSDKSAYPTVLYLVDNPAQVKSATDNLGTFDKFESDIRYSEETNLDEKFSYDNLVRKPDMNVVIINDSKFYSSDAQTRKGIIEAAIKNAKDVGRTNENGNAVVHVEDSGADIIVSKRGVEHGLDRRLNSIGAITENVGSILKNSILINKLTPKKASAAEAYVYIGTAKSSTGFYVVEFVVNRYSNELSQIDILYSANTKKEAAALNAPRVMNNSLAITASTISIADLLQIVNSYFPDVLPESVLRHFGYDSRPEGILGESALYSEETNGTDPHSILLADMEMTAKTQTEKNFVEKYRENVEKVVELETELEYLNSEIKEISFTKGSDRSRLASLNARKKAVLYKINLFDSKLTEYRGYKVFQNMIDRNNARQKAEERKLRNKIKRELLDKAVELAERRRKKDVMSDIAKRLTEIDRLASSDTRHKHLPSATVELVARMRMPISVDF